jgi:hypothetical protein
MPLSNIKLHAEVSGSKTASAEFRALFIFAIASFRSKVHDSWDEMESASAGYFFNLRRESHSHCDVIFARTRASTPKPAALQVVAENSMGFCATQSERTPVPRFDVQVLSCPRQR